MDRMQLQAAIAAITRMWRTPFMLEEQKKLLVLCNNLVGAHFD
jgi:hypothetical protein